VVRGSWFVVRGSWFVVRGSWFCSLTPGTGIANRISNNSANLLGVSPVFIQATHYCNHEYAHIAVKDETAQAARKRPLIFRCEINSLLATESPSGSLPAIAQILISGLGFAARMP
jgi:hypothetical protein